MADADSLVKLHAEVMAAIRDYQPPAALVGLLDEEYAGYVLNTTRGSLYYQWLALAVWIMRLVPQPNFVPSTVMSDLRVRLFVGDDLDLSVVGDELPVGIDPLLIDTDHTYTQVSAEWRIYRHLCRLGALGVLDDINMNDMRRFSDSLPYAKLDLTAECHL